VAEFRGKVRAKPGASRARVGGGYGPENRLIVAVSAPAVDGRANDAVLRALAAALGLRPSRLRLVGGERSRDKVVAISDPPEGLAAQWARLLDGDAAGG
jgi:hypothetical protein